MSYLCFLLTVDGGVLWEGSCLICAFYLLWMVVSCRWAHVLFVFFIDCRWWCPVGGLMSYLCFFIYYGWWCPVGGLMSYLCFLFIVDGGVL